MPHAPPHVVSASRRTDIPAFYGEWFRRRLAAGWCETANPFSGQVYRVSLAPRDVLGWVFWSRNYEPFLDVLRGLHEQRQPFICHFTIIGYPRVFEPRAPDADRMAGVARRLAETFGPEAVLWRYDPILLSSLTPPEWHEANFARLAAGMRGAAQRCIFSFPTMYKKTVRNLERIGREAPNAPLRVWSRAGGDFSLDDLAALARRLAAVARANGMEMHSCCGERWVDPAANLFKAHCADWPLLLRLGAGRNVETERRESTPPNAPLHPMQAGSPHHKVAETATPDPASACASPPDVPLRPVRSEPRQGRPGETPPPDVPPACAQPPDVPLHPTRKECGCYRSVDIGRYHTCAHGCAYCYAVEDAVRARDALAAHDPASSRL